MAFLNKVTSCLSPLKSVLQRPPALGQLRSIYAIREESIDRYCKGGYHPVRIGDKFKKDQYSIANKIGYGVYSTVWLAFDHQRQHHVALKILTSDSFGHGHKTFEVDMLKLMRTHDGSMPGMDHVLHLLDDFEHQGPNGNHACLVFKAMGPDLDNCCLLYPFLHDTCNVVHTDIKPNNILVQTSAINEMFQKAPSEVFYPPKPPAKPPQDYYMESTQVSSAEEDIACPTDISIRLADLGAASWKEKHLTEWIQPQMLRRPEVILGASWDHKVDIWNLGLVIWELAEGQLVFDGCWTPQEEYSPEAHLAQMTAIFGVLPEDLLNRSKFGSRHFDDHDRLLHPSPFPACSFEGFSKNPNLLGQEKEELLSFIKSMVHPDPAERPDARELLKSPWLARKN